MSFRTPITFIYLLSTPKNLLENEELYVGKTNNPNRRLADHRRGIQYARDNRTDPAVQRVYRYCATRHLSPWKVKLEIAEILYDKTEMEVAKAELAWIEKLKGFGCELQNVENPVLALRRARRGRNKKVTRFPKTG